MGNKGGKSNPGVLTEAEIRLLENNTGMSRQQIETWFREFMRDYPDGSIDEKEFVAIFKKTYPQGKPEKYAKIAFKAFDDNKSGKITFSEFLLSTSFIISGNGSKEKNLDFAFDIYDSDNNGKITKKEMDQIIAALYDLSGKDVKTAKTKVKEIFARFDSDNNGSLSKAEFINFMLNDPVCSEVFHM